ncbi:MAG: class I SAM-dependent methyltransferase [Propionibacteriaceae bacterium]|nr:class I SAM-dependent methyltransferase [Propionibacteriaceae bacterium]
MHDALTAEERLTAVYDEDNPNGPDHDFFRALASARGVENIIDLGCGTGILTVTLSGDGRTVMGIDPNEAMLSRAMNRPGGDRVSWVLGTSRSIPTASADLVIMSGNVAMHILRNDWHQALHDISRGLRPDGLLVFETRNPLFAEWRRWNHPPTERDTVAGRLRESLATTTPDEHGIVTMSCDNEFLDDGAVFHKEQRLQFRSLNTITNDLAAAGLKVVNVWRNWQREPFTDTPEGPLMIFEVLPTRTP